MKNEFILTEEEIKEAVIDFVRRRGTIPSDKEVEVSFDMDRGYDQRDPGNGLTARASYNT